MGVGERDGAGPDAGGDHGDGEAGAFFVGPVHDGEGELSVDLVFVEDLEELDGGGDAEDAVIASAGGLGVEVGAGAGGGPGAAAMADGELVAHGVGGEGAAELTCFRHEPFAGLFVGGGEGEAGHANVSGFAERELGYFGCGKDMRECKVLYFPQRSPLPHSEV